MTDQPSEHPRQGAVPGQPPHGAPQSPPTYGAPPPQPTYGAPPPQPTYGGPPAEQPYPPPVDNPYAAAPPPAPGQPAAPGSLRAVEASFGRVATFGDRAVAWLIDLGITLSGLILVVLGVIVLVVADGGSVTFENGATTTTSSDPVLTAVGVVLVVVGYAAMLGLWLWNRVFRMGRTGQSVGKSTQGLMLIDSRTGQPIGAGSAFLRDVVHGLANQVFYLSFLWMLWDPDRETLGDKAVHSTVIHVPRDAQAGRAFTA